MNAEIKDLEKLVVPMPESVTSLEIRYGDMLQDDAPAFERSFSRALESFQSLESLSLQGQYASLLVRIAIPTINECNIPLARLILDDVHWACFDGVPGCWKTVFAKLKHLYIDIDYDHKYENESALGLKTVLEWALSVENLHLKMQWDLFFDDFAVETSWPNLKALCMGNCSVTKEFLLRFLERHCEVRRLDMNAFVMESKKGQSPITFEDAGKIISLPLFDVIKGVISQDNELMNSNKEHGNWGKARFTSE